MKTLIVRLFCVLVCAVSLAAYARDAAPLAADPVVEARLQSIAEELRCLVCQNETLASSHAELAEDLRRELRTLIKQGKSDAEIMSFMVERYGDFVRYRPPLKRSTWLLWFGPFVLLATAAIALMIYLRKRDALPAPAGLSAEQKKKAATLLGESKNRNKGQI